MNCPYCDFHFKVLLANEREIPPVAPVVCEKCGEVSLLIEGEIRKASDEEIRVLKTAPCWKSVIEPARRAIAAVKRSRNN